MPLVAKDKKPVLRLTEAAAVFSEVMATPDKDLPDGFNADAEEYEGLVIAGVIDLTKVTRSALQIQLRL